MLLSALKPILSRLAAFGSLQEVMDDASDLMRRHGERAHDVAQLKSFQEAIGRSLTPRPGHWDRVAREIATRRGRTPFERRADFTALAAGRPS